MRSDALVGGTSPVGDGAKVLVLLTSALLLLKAFMLPLPSARVLEATAYGKEEKSLAVLVLAAAWRSKEVC